MLMLPILFFGEIISAQNQPKEVKQDAVESFEKLDSIVLYKLEGGIFAKPVPDAKMEFIYDLEGRVICRNRLDWNKEDSVWLLNDKSSALFDKKGRNVQKNIFFWKDHSVNLQYGIKKEFIYEERNARPRKICYAWDLGSDRWKRIENCDSIDDRNFDFPLDPEELITYPDSCPDPETGLFGSCKKEEKTYNKNNDLVRFKIYTRLVANGKWKLAESSKIKYDAQPEIPVSNIVLPRYFPDLLNIYYLNSTSSDKKISGKIMEFSRTVITPEGKYRETGRFYYSTFPD